MPARRVRLPAEARVALERIAALKHSAPVWLVGGAIRDAALGRPLADLDLTCVGARDLARRIATAMKGSFVVLDEGTAVYRVALAASPRGLRQIDVAELQGKNIEEDLARRDFTVNAVAWPLAPRAPAVVDPREFVDPRGGLADLAKRRLVCERDGLFAEDPLRLLRAFRVAAQVGLKIEPATTAMIRRHRALALKPAGERIQAELNGLLATPGAAPWLVAMDECGLLTAVFPELEPSRTCAVDYYGEGGVLKHSLTVCSRLETFLDSLPTLYPDLAAPLSARLAPIRSTLLLAALLHDVAKPATAKLEDGRLRFFEHDRLGGVDAGRILRKFRFPGATIEAVTGIIHHHLRPGHLAASDGPVTDRAAYRFFRDLGDLAPALLAVCWGDHASYLAPAALKRLAKNACSLKPSPPERVRPDARKTVRHLHVVSHLLRRCFDPAKAPVPERLLDGTAVMKLLRIKPGPSIGRALEALREAQAEGVVKTLEQARAFVSRLRLDA